LKRRNRNFHDLMKKLLHLNSDDSKMAFLDRKKDSFLLVSMLHIGKNNNSLIKIEIRLKMSCRVTNYS